MAGTRDVFWALHPLITFSRLVGASALQSGPKTNLSLRHISPSFVTLFFLVSVLFLNYPDYMRQASEDESFYRSFLALPIYIIWWALSLIRGITSCAVALTRRRAIGSIMNKIAHVDALVFGPRVYPHLIKMRKLTSLHSITTFTLFFASSLYEGYKLYHRINYTTIIMLFASFISIVSAVSMDAQFYTLLLVIGERLRLMNESISLLYRPLDEPKDVVHRESQIRGLNHQARSFYQASGNSSSKLEQVRVLSRTHFELIQISVDLNCAFGFFILIQTIMNSLQLSFHVYFIVYMAAENHDMSKYGIGQLLAWSLPYFVELVVITASCHAIIREVNLTGSLVSEAILRIREQCVRRETSFSIQLHLFSNHLLLKKMRFTACGFFTLELGLLKTIIAAILSNIVILIQFK